MSVTNNGPIVNGFPVTITAKFHSDWNLTGYDFLYTFDHGGNTSQVSYAVLDSVVKKITPIRK